MIMRHSLIKTLLKSLKGSDWGMLTDFVSPVFFEVVPAFAVAEVFGKIVAGYGDKTKFARIKEDVSERIGRPLDLRLAESVHRSSSQSLSNDARKERGRKVLELYFAQLMVCDTAILDLRSSAFGDNLDWCPAALSYHWQPDFRRAIADMYRGFYHGDDAVFSGALKALDLTHASAIFREHFGKGGQEAVVFDLSSFKSSFHAIFLSCKENRSRLHPDFFALGIYLVCLYEHLEELGIPLDVRSAFMSVDGLL
jgi:hypothetical protein